MSYDLYFTEPKISQREFENYFKERKNYQLNNGQAWYGNEDTGVYFSFEYPLALENEKDFPNEILFNLNYNRPHFFALEAEPEVSRFIHHFGFKTQDPQIGGMDDAPYTSEGFFKGWNHGNKFAINDIPKENRLLNSRSTKELERIWKWNYEREKNQNETGEMIFIPRITFIHTQGKLYSAIIWTDGIPIIMPEVDMVVIMRNEYAPRRLFIKKPDICLVPFNAIVPALTLHKVNNLGFHTYTLDSQSPSKNTISFIKKLAPYTEDLEGVAMDQILNNDL